MRNRCAEVMLRWRDICHKANHERSVVRSLDSLLGPPSLPLVSLWARYRFGSYPV